jgi:1,2-diacylglycerol 3-alpha-glucosyltransferase
MPSAQDRRGRYNWRAEMPSSAASATRVLLACSGLDHAHRGFESFARECFESLREEPGLDIELVKGSGPSAPRERSVPTLTRDMRLARTLGRVFSTEPFRFEQLAFALSLQPALARRRPDVVYFSEWHTGLVLAHLRRLTGGRFRLVLCNGTMATQGFGHLDRVQELTPSALELALERGAEPSRHVMLPLGFAIDRELNPITAQDCRSLRERLALPVDRRIVVSVAALNSHHKRLDYLIEELARLPPPRPYLLLVGQPEAQTPGLRALAMERLGPEGHDVRTVSQTAVVDLLRAVDLFVLASLGEGLPRALIEAMAQGLPCLVHDYEVTRFALGPHGYFADLSKSGALARLVADATKPAEQSDQRARHRFAYQNYSWDRLRPRYVELLRHWPAARAP